MNLVERLTELYSPPAKIHTCKMLDGCSAVQLADKLIDLAKMPKSKSSASDNQSTSTQSATMPSVMDQNVLTQPIVQLGAVPHTNPSMPVGAGQTYIAPHAYGGQAVTPMPHTGAVFPSWVTSHPVQGFTSMVSGSTIPAGSVAPVRVIGGDVMPQTIPQFGSSNEPMSLQGPQTMQTQIRLPLFRRSLQYWLLSR